MKNTTVLVIVGLVLIGLIGGGYYFIFGNKTAKQPVKVAPQIEEEAIPISADDIGLKFTLRDDSKAAKFSISNPKGIKAIEYQISYTKNVDGEEVPEGLIGEVEVNPNDEIIETNYREFGTCSSGKCRYDNVISPVTLTLKITKEDGKVYQTEKTLEI